MDFQPRTIINGALLRRYSEKLVSIMAKVEDIDSSGRVIKAKTTDNLDIRINLAEPVTSPVNNWIEIIGKPSGPDSIKCSEVLYFKYLSLYSLCLICIFNFQFIQFDTKEGDEELDVESHNMLVQFLALAHDVYRTG